MKTRPSELADWKDIAEMRGHLLAALDKARMLAGCEAAPGADGWFVRFCAQSLIQRLEGMLGDVAAAAENESQTWM